MSIQTSNFDQASVERWLENPENKDFANSFCLKWLKSHPELHKEAFLGFSSTTNLSKERLSMTRSDSGVELQSKTLSTKSKSCDSLVKLGSCPSVDTEEYPVVVKPLTVAKPAAVEEKLLKLQQKLKQQEGVVELTVELLSNFTNPQYVLNRILLKTMKLVTCFNCRFLLLEDEISNPNLTPRKTRKFSRVYEAASDMHMSEVKHLDGKEMDVRQLTGIELAREVVKKGHLFMFDSQNTLLCYPVPGVDGQIVGVMQLFGDSLKSRLDLDFVEELALISGLAIDNSVCFSMLRKATKHLLNTSARLSTPKKAVTPGTSKQPQASKVPACVPKLTSTPKKLNVARAKSLQSKELAATPLLQSTVQKPMAPPSTAREAATVDTQTATINNARDKATPFNQKTASVATNKSKVDAEVVPVLAMPTPFKEVARPSQDTEESESSPAIIPVDEVKENTILLEDAERSSESSESIPSDNEIEATSQDDLEQPLTTPAKLKKPKKKKSKGVRVLRAPFKAIKKLVHRAIA